MILDIFSMLSDISTPMDVDLSSGLKSILDHNSV